MTPLRHRRRETAAPRDGREAFTLVELVVVIVILAILASLTLSGLNGARQRAKIDKTRSTIRKLHEIVIPIYESYVEKRYSPVATSNDRKTTIAEKQLAWKRMLMTLDMPDQWADVDVPGFQEPIDSVAFRPSAASLRYSAIKRAGVSPAYQSAECLYMIVVRGGFAPDAVEQFRADEIGNLDGDGAPEFLDGWGRPISFIRWPAGFDRSAIQQTAASVNQAILLGTLPAGSKPAPDPMDPLRVSADDANDANSPYDTALIPLIYSGGISSSLDDPPADLQTEGEYGLVTSALAVQGGWLKTITPGNPFPSMTNRLRTTRLTDLNYGGMPLLAGSVNSSDPLAPPAARDNITNHDLVTK